MQEVALFDLDGVLIRPGGYRMALKKTLTYFIDQLGLDATWLPGEEEIACFESRGITGEWDMVPIWLLLVLDSLLAQAQQPVYFSDWEEVRLWRKDQANQAIRSPFSEAILRCGADLLPDMPASDSILAVCRNGRLAELFPNLQGHQILEHLLSDTRDVKRSHLTQVLQAFILGNDQFERLFGIPAPISSLSTLEVYDQPLVGSAERDILIDRFSQGDLHLAAMTARPTAPPEGNASPKIGYTPEAEIALNKLGFANMPLVGYGAVQWVAEQAGLRADFLLKPAHFQALGALACAVNSDAQNALRWAYQLVHRVDPVRYPPLNHTDLTTKTLLSDEIRLHVFEDSPIGIRSVLGAAEVLREHGIKVTVQAWGIAVHGEKKAALESLGAAVYSNVNQALRAAWPDWFPV